jgi:hypothetical protein
MKRLFSELIENYDDYKFECETYFKAKSHHISYLSSLSKSGSPFDLVHSDV